MKGGKSKMEEQEMLKLGIGEKEATALKPAKVKIVKITVESVGEKKNLKASFESKHPDKEDTVKISEVKYEQKGKLTTSGTWINLDEDKKLRKGSALTILIKFLGCNNLEECEGKEIDTCEDDKGYLCFKAY
jgi:hypothetical protein